MDTTVILIIASSLDFDTLISFYQVSKATQIVLNGKEVLILLGTIYNLDYMTCFHHFVEKYARKYPCMRSFLYLRPEKVSIMAAKALNFNLIEEAAKRGSVDLDVIKYSIKASLKADKNVIHDCVMRIFKSKPFKLSSCIYPKMDSGFVEFPYYYGSESMGDYFRDLLDRRALDDQDMNLLIAACHGGLFYIVEEYVEEYARDDPKDLCIFLHSACRGKRRNIIDFLISKGASLDVPNGYFNDYIESAIRSGFLDLVISVHGLKKSEGINYEHYIALADRKGHTDISDYLKSCM